MGILNWLYPKRCPVCHQILRGKGKVCPPCKSKLYYIREPKCKKCGKEIEKNEEEYCKDCQRFSHSFDKGAAVFAYDERMRRSISMFKYHNRREYAAFYASEMYEQCKSFLELCKPDVLIPVPIHKQKRRKRGFNQAELVAKELGKLLHVPIDCKCLIRTEKTTPQKELTRRQRKENLKKAFQAADQEITYERILIIDDIYTTGATIDAVCDILREKNAKNLFFLTICVGRND